MKKLIILLSLIMTSFYTVSACTPRIIPIIGSVRWVADDGITFRPAERTLVTFIDDDNQIKGTGLTNAYGQFFIVPGLLACAHYRINTTGKQTSTMDTFGFVLSPSDTQPTFTVGVWLQDPFNRITLLDNPIENLINIKKYEY